MRTIAIDAMGGENAPDAIVKAVLQAKTGMPETKFLLFGDKEALRKLIPEDQINDQLGVVPTTEVIADEDEPVKAIRKKKDSSMVVAANFVKEGKADALLSLGNTGALLACGIFIIGRIKGIVRPGLMPTLPVQNSDDGFNMVDVGANAKSKPEYLLQWAEMASYYAEKIRGIKNPRVMLLNNGAESDKGDDVHQKAYELLKESNLNFLGNIEGNELLLGKADVVVTDGFTGNAVLKNIEGTSSVLLHLLKDSLLNGGVMTKLGALMVKGSLSSLKSKFDTAKYGGAVLLGVNAPVVKTHGRSNERPIYFTLKQVDKMVKEKLVADFRDEFAEKWYNVLLKRRSFMSEEEIFNKIKDMIADNFDVDKDKITENTNFMDDLDADSIDLVEFILQLEDEFGAEIPDDEAEKIKTIGDAVSYIKSHQG